MQNDLVQQELTQIQKNDGEKSVPEEQRITVSKDAIIAGIRLN